MASVGSDHAEHGKEKLVGSSSSSCWPLLFCTKCIPITTATSPENSPPPDTPTKQSPRRPGGWRAMPFVLGNETFERLATIGLMGNFMVFLLTQFHMDQVRATNLLNVWSGVTNFTPLIGAFVSDAYIGRFRTIAFASFASFLGMVTLTVTVAVPQLHPSPCGRHQDQCAGPTTGQLGVLLTGLCLLSIGSGGIRPCSLPFGVDQFDPSTDEGRRGITSFYNWYYTTFTVILIIALTVVVYVQDSVSWLWGFAGPTILMFCSIVLFFLGTNIYVHAKPTGSVFSGIAQVVVAAYRKRRVRVPADGEGGGVLYDPPMKESAAHSKLPLTYQYRLLTRAAVVLDGELNPDGSRANPWRLCTVQQVEEFKCIIRIIPIWAAGIISFTAIVQQSTFTISQALKMDRHLGPKFQIPPGSLGVISMLTIGIWVPVYDRIVVPRLRRITKIEGGITLLQRIGIGIVFSTLSMVVAGVVERKRRSVAVAHGGVAPMSVFWLAPQLVLMGFAEAFNIIGQIEFYNRQFPEHMTSVGNALFSCTMAGSNYLSALLVTVVHDVTGKHGRQAWLTQDINAGRVDYFYYIIAGLGVLNMVYFLICARRYRYKGSTMQFSEGEGKSDFDVEMNSIKQ
ncbi:protein NRT1/ PTR FAMILY 2.13 [Malania oleifera]|uniref:protein NRT1/ PTR FAMILY 2.13 n=1 Tax=Malania oleifera TaxID=397392 RepID=UPI0025ADF5F6|nr:protein NRT1/ PTR FAMILY 2.13 [Malania oleifera]